MLFNMREMRVYLSVTSLFLEQNFVVVDRFLLLKLLLPLFIVTMASQNLPGVAAQRASGFQTPISASISATGLASLLLAPFGGYAFNLAAITAAIDSL